MAGDKALRLQQYGVDGAQLRHRSPLSRAFRAAFASFSALRLLKFFLFLLGEPQHLAQTFIVDDLSLIDFRQFIKGLERQFSIAVLHRNMTIRVVEYFDHFAGEMDVFLIIFNEIKNLVILKGQLCQRLVGASP